MSDLDSRLASLDPAAGRPYAHRNLEAMIERVTREPARARRRWWLGFRFKIVGAVGASAAVTAAAVVALGGVGTGLPLVAIQSALTGAGQLSATTFAPSSPPSSISSNALAPSQYVVARSALSTSTPAVESRRILLPVSPSKEIARLAKVFGVSGPAHFDASTRQWTVASGSGAAIEYDAAGLATWYYSSSTPSVAPATASGRAATTMPSTRSVERLATRYLRRLGVGYAVASPRVSTSTVSSLVHGRAVTSSQETLTCTVRVEGVATSQSVVVTVDAHDRLLYASGPVFRLGQGLAYPLRSASKAVAALDQGRAASASSSAATTPVRRVTVRLESTVLVPFKLRDGALWLLPVYRYGVSPKASVGVGEVTAWSVLAIEPRYLHVDSGASGVSPTGSLAG